MNGDASARCRAAFDRFRSGQVDEAIQEIRLLAAGGYPRAQVFAGWASELGRGVLGAIRGLMWFVSVPALATRLAWNEPDDPNILESWSRG